MTVAARISQADMERATKSVVAAGIERARIVMDLANQKIEIIIGDDSAGVSAERNPWDDE